MNDASRVSRDPVACHAEAVAAEISWLGQCIEIRLKHFFGGEERKAALPPPPDAEPESALGQLLAETGMDAAARLVLALSLAPHVDSAVLDPFYVRNSAIDRLFSQFGGLPNASGAFFPTIETALFLLAGTDTAARITAMRLFDPDHPLRRRAGLRLGQSGTAQGAALDLPVHRIIALCDGVPPRPDFTPDFPARRLTTRLG